MSCRIIYTLLQAWRYRRQLACYTREAKLRCDNIINLSPKALLQQGIKAIIIDFDGVLAAYNEIVLPVAVQEWLQECSKYFGSNNVFILSNKPTLARQQYFAKYFSEVNFVVAQYKKPFPHSIFTIIAATKFLAKEIVVVDDRLLTGILAAIISNTQGCFITKPFVRTHNILWLEKLHTFLRWLEIKVLQYY